LGAIRYPLSDAFAKADKYLPQSACLCDFHVAGRFRKFPEPEIGRGNQ
jgi:hypothetical protein